MACITDRRLFAKILFETIHKYCCAREDRCDNEICVHFVASIAISVEHSFGKYSNNFAFHCCLLWLLMFEKKFFPSMNQWWKFIGKTQNSSIKCLIITFLLSFSSMSSANKMNGSRGKEWNRKIINKYIFRHWIMQFLSNALKSYIQWKKFK